MPTAPPLIPIRRHIVLISGFRQHHGRATTGLDQLWQQLHTHLADTETVIWLKSWSDDFRALAAQIDQYRLGYPVQIETVAYSWGVGVGAIRLAEELAQYDLKIETLFSIDGVYKPWFPLPVRSLFSRWNPCSPEIRVPANIEQIIYFQQKRNRPQGHRLKGVSMSQIVRPAWEPEGLLAGHTHQTIDNSQAIHRYIEERLINR